MSGLWLVLLLVAGLAALALAVVLLVRRREVARPPVDSRAPARAVVLVHGFLGFDHISLLGKRWNYFRGIAPRLQAMGLRVHAVRVPPLASVPERAARLAEQIAALPDARVVILAHSMGGLDARWAIHRLGLADRVSALVTIGTPHRGTPLAELGGRAPLLRLLAGDCTTRALEWLTPAHLARFNLDVPDHAGVFYGSVVAHAVQHNNPILAAGHSLLARRCGRSDGLVPADSQPWGEVLAEVEADHWAQVGWSRSFDAAAAYARVLDVLAARGLWAPDQSAKANDSMNLSPRAPKSTALSA